MRTTLNVALIAAVAATAGCGPGGSAPCDVLVGHPVGNPHREMPDLDMLAGDTVEIPLGRYLSIPPECSGNGLLEARSSDPAAVAVWIADDLTTLAVAAVAVADSVRVVAQRG